MKWLIRKIFFWPVTGLCGCLWYIILPLSCDLSGWMCGDDKDKIDWLTHKDSTEYDEIDICDTCNIEDKECGTCTI